MILVSSENILNAKENNCQAVKICQTLGIDSKENYIDIRVFRKLQQ